MYSMQQLIILITLVSATKCLNYVKFTDTIGDQEQYHPSRRRMKRSLDAGSTDTMCNDVLDETAKRAITKFSFPLKDDRNLDLQVEFVGRNDAEKNTTQRQLLLTTMPVHSFQSLFVNHHKSSNLWQSEDEGRTFQLLDKEINSASIRKDFGIMKSPLDPNRVIFVSLTNTGMGMMGSLFGGFRNMFNGGGSFMQPSHLLISKDGCKTFKTVNLPFKLRAEQSLLFHPKKKDWIIALEERASFTSYSMGKSTRKEYGHAYISKDFGENWKKLMPNTVAVNVKWGAAKGKEGDEIFISAHDDKKKETVFKSIFSLMHMPDMSSSETLSLWRSSDDGATFKKIIEHCYRFGVEGDFVFASVVLNVSDSDHDTQKRIMHLSKDGGENFHRAFIPEITDNEFYAVMDMHEGMIFLHVDNTGNTGKGTLFISGADGLMYTQSLENHFYTNGGHHDFTKIESMPGVYITQQLKDDNTLKSVITFDRGVTWQPLYVDRQKYCNNTKTECSLHFHKVYSNVQRRMDIQGPLSHKNAPGIIILHGQAGDALTGAVQVWRSTNGGYNWTKVADHPHHYAIADNGNLLVMVPRLNNTGNILKYSIDQGKCWQKYKFSDDNQQLVVHGLATEPNAQDRKFSLWGYLPTGSFLTREWVVKTINFHKMFTKKCSDSSDFDSWTPHIRNGKTGCFLGQKFVYKRTKATVACYLGNDFKPLVSSSACACTKDDMECDYGYEKSSTGECKKNSNIKPIKVCKNGEEMKKTFTRGYRRVPGDKCKTGPSRDKSKFIDEKKRCDTEKEVIDSFGIIKEENALIKELQNQNNKPSTIEKKTDIKNYDAKKTVSESGYQVHSKLPIPKRKGSAFLVIVAILAVVGVIAGMGWYGKKYINLRSSRPSYVLSDLADDDDGNTDLHVYNPKPKTERPYQDEETDADDDTLLEV